MVNDSKSKGKLAEQHAQHYLEHQGLKIIDTNYHCAFGEIDLIMQDKNHLVFVEVRSRVPQGYGNALESVSRSKQLKIIKTAEHYLMTNENHQSQFCRFDIVTIENKNDINWYQNAFEIEG